MTILSTNSQFMIPEVPTSANIPSFNNNGWCYRNIITANACNGSLLWYNNGDYGSIQTYPTQSNIEVKDLDIFYVILQNYYPATQSKIQMNIYTKNQGSGDFSVNYRSKFNYTISGSPYIAMGQSYMIYNGQLNRVKLNDPEVPRVLYSLNSGNSQGPQANTEIISHIELLFTSTGGDTFLCNILEGGVYSKNGHLVNYYFDNDLKAKNEYLNISANNVIGQLSFNPTLSLYTNLSNDCENSVAIKQNTTGTAVNLKDQYGLVSSSILYGKNDSGDIKNLTIDADGYMNCNIKNSVSLNTSGNTVKIDQTGSNNNVSFAAGSTVGIDSSTNTIKIDSSNNKIKIDDGTNTANVLSPLANLSTSKGLVCNSILKAWNTTSGDINPLTVNLNGDKNQLEVRDNDAVAELTSIDTKTVQQYNTTNNSISGYNSNNVALSTYVIPSKTKTFIFSAFTGNTATNAFIGSINSSTTFSNANFGLANSRPFYVIRSGTTSASMSLDLTYIDASGNEQAAIVAAPIPTTLTAISGVTGITINSVRANQTYTTNDTVSIAYSNNINTSFAGANFYQNNNALFTCPNNAIAWVQSVTFFSQAADNLRLFRWTAQGVRETFFAWTNQTNFNATSSGEYGFGGYITAGQTIGWGGENSSTSKIVYANVIVKYFN